MARPLGTCTACLNFKFAVNHVDFNIAGWEGCNFPVIVEASRGGGGGVCAPMLPNNNALISQNP